MKKTETTSSKSTYAPELETLRKAGFWFKPKGSILAGGALTSVFTGKPVNDIDLYFKDEASFRKAVERAYDNGMWCCEVTSRAVTFSDNGTIIQLMYFDWFETPEDIFKAFDFTCCMAAYDIDSEQFTFHENFMRHSSQRYLSFHSGTLFPFASLLRVLKYQSRDYTIGKSDMLRIALKCHEQKLESWDELLDQVGGYYGEQINLNKEGDFSIMAAITALEKVNTDLSSPTTKEHPSNASDLLKKILPKVSE